MENVVYEKVGKMVKAEILTNFEDIAAQIGKHNLCAALGMAFETLTLRIAKPGMWRVDELAKLSGLLGIESIFLLRMADQLRVQKKK